VGAKLFREPEAGVGGQCGMELCHLAFCQNAESCKWRGYNLGCLLNGAQTPDPRARSRTQPVRPVSGADFPGRGSAAQICKHNRKPGSVVFYRGALCGALCRGLWNAHRETRTFRLPMPGSFEGLSPGIARRNDPSASLTSGPRSARAAHRV